MGQKAKYNEKFKIANQIQMNMRYHLNGITYLHANEVII